MLAFPHIHGNIFRNEVGLIRIRTSSPEGTLVKLVSGCDSDAAKPPHVKRTRSSHPQPKGND